MWVYVRSEPELLHGRFWTRMVNGIPTMIMAVKTRRLKEYII